MCLMIIEELQNMSKSKPKYVICETDFMSAIVTIRCRAYAKQLFAHNF